MKNLVLAAAVALAALGATGSAAQAMPSTQLQPPERGVIQVAEGCGPGAHRTPYGRCVPNYERRGYRGCPPRMHSDRFGRCRPNF